MPDEGRYRAPDSPTSGGLPYPRDTTRSRVVGQQAYQVPYRDDYAARPRSGPSRQGGGPRSTWPLVLLGAIGVVLIAVGVNLAFRFLGEEDGGAGELGATATPASGTSSSTTSIDQASTAEAPVGDPSVQVTVPAAGVFVQATYDGNLVTISGSVPAEADADSLLAVAEATYTAERVQSQLTVDAALGTSPEWLAPATSALPLLQIADQITMVIADGQILMTGQAKATGDVGFLEAQLVDATGLPVATGEFQISDLRPVIYVIALSGGQLVLSGALPDEELRQGFYDVAAEIYGADNVVDASTVDPAVNSELWMKDPGAMLAAVGAFSEFEVRFEGDRVVSRLSGGPTFDAGSAEISPELAGVLDFGILAMLREPTMTQVIRGYTDDTGPEEVNQALSQQRADAARAYMLAGGIEPERVTAIGMGEADPIATNDTPEGRATNRRIELVVDSDPMERGEADSG